ncbi:type II toxin-antitoxin system HicB family antitoxin [Algoriphagus aquimarinus]|uniref:Type II toxin-antitoxin system HicB family antitoxin n=1 Tax=Algoriphagus aquimarinus TaxID=237018 RepID=A0A5C7AAM2_9BACT|nr:type II toxin-antitoxin system HicB family antitoxin [Algoriphagus aquimarinus]TXE02678.1 type II toxin-antitoxin system HicB family antitoxin [Algoriphagus aquimarinus]
MANLVVDVTWEDNFGAYSEDVSGCVATHKSLEGVKEAYTSALKLHLEGILEDEDEIPSVLQGDYDLVFRLNTQALLKTLDGKISRAAIARASGINERQLGHYITGRVVPRADNRKKVIEGIHQIAQDLLKVV